jgi:hypothetical protein
VKKLGWQLNEQLDQNNTAWITPLQLANAEVGGNGMLLVVLALNMVVDIV